MGKMLFFFVSLSYFTINLSAQDYTKDVQSIDSITKALYDVISGDAGQPRDWDRFKNLFMPDARLTKTGGINSIQLLKTKDRYYIMNIFWCAESLGFPLPAKYLN